MSDMVEWPVDVCGTPRGYARHRYLHEDPCAPCRRAHADRIAALRAQRGRSNPERERRWAAAHTWATAQLARENPGRYQELLHQHLTRKDTNG